MKIYVIEDNNDLTLDDFMIGLKNIPDKDIDHWQTDLYLRKTPETTKLIQTKLPKSFKVTTFIDNIDKVPWYEIPFAFSKSRKRTGKTVKESIDKTLPFNYRGMGVIDINVTNKWPTGKHIWNIGKHNPYIDKGYVIVCNTRDYNVIPETLEFVYVGPENAEVLHKEAGRHTINDKNYKKYLVVTDELTESNERYTIENLKKLIRELLDEKGFNTGVIRYDRDKNTLDISLAEENNEPYQWEVIKTPIGKTIDFNDINSIAEFAEATVDTVIGKYYDLVESILTENEDDIETWDVSFWDAEEQESYDTKTVRMTKDEVEDYVNKLNAKRSEYDKENGSFYDYVLA